MLESIGRLNCKKGLIFTLRHRAIKTFLEVIYIPKLFKALPFRSARKVIQSDACTVSLLCYGFDADIHHSRSFKQITETVFARRK